MPYHVVVIALLAFILWRVFPMSDQLNRLSASIASLTAEDDKLLGILTDFASHARENADDPAAITALADTVDAEVAKLQAAEAGAGQQQG
jgi:hypothetical protein